MISNTAWTIHCDHQWTPVIHDGDDLAWFKGELIVLGCLKVIDGPDLSALSLVRGEEAAGARVEARQRDLRLLPLVLQRQFDRWERETDREITSLSSRKFVADFNITDLCPPLARSSSSFLFVDVAGSLATNAGLALACSAAWTNKVKHLITKHSLPLTEIYVICNTTFPAIDGPFRLSVISLLYSSGRY